MFKKQKTEDTTKVESKPLDDDKDNDIHQIITPSSTFNIPTKYLLISSFIKTLLTTTLCGEKKEINFGSTSILAKTDPKILQYIFATYMQNRKGIDMQIAKKPLRYKELKKNYDDDNAITIANFEKFIGIDEKFDKKRLYELIITANFLDIEGLLNLACARVACIIKNEPIDVIKDLLSVTKE